MSAGQVIVCNSPGCKIRLVKNFLSLLNNASVMEVLKRTINIYAALEAPCSSGGAIPEEPLPGSWGEAAVCPAPQRCAAAAGLALGTVAFASAQPMLREAELLAATGL